MFENHKKVSLTIASEASYVVKYYYERTKVHKKCQKWSILVSFENPKFSVQQCYQTGQF